MKRVIALSLAVAAIAFATNLDTIKAEPNLERRSKLALDNANAAVDASREAYSAGKIKQSKIALAEVRDSVDLCFDSLKATGKEARKSPKPFKRAELNIRELIRRLKSLENDFNVDDRDEILKTEQRLQEVHDELITRIMSKH